MNIGINLLFLIPGGVGGTEIFARKLISNLGSLEIKHKYIIYGNYENASLWKDLPKNFKVITCPFYARKRFVRILWEQFFLPFQCAFNRIDLLHSVGYTSPIVTHCPKITTIYDLNYHYHPEDFTIWNRFVFEVLIPLVANSANKLIVHSNGAKKEIIKVVKIKPQKIKVIYGGVDEQFRKVIKPSVRERVLKKYKIPKNFILSNAVSHPHKNLKSLLLGFSELIKRNKNIKEHLVMLGFAARAQEELDNIAKTNKIKNRIHFTGWVDPVDVPVFYQEAKVFVFPSLYEGFGLPIVEAMASGVPLIASDSSCIPEIVGDGGVLIDAKNTHLISATIEKILTDKLFANKLRDKGLVRSEIFSWEDLAQDTISVYNSFNKK